jgi:hypothetical protein
MKPSFANDVFRRGAHPLDPFFKPRSIAVIGATETPGSVGRTLLPNLTATSFGGASTPSIRGGRPCSATRFASLFGAPPPKLSEIPYPVLWAAGLFVPLVRAADHAIPLIEGAVLPDTREPAHLVADVEERSSRIQRCWNRRRRGARLFVCPEPLRIRAA